MIDFPSKPSPSRPGNSDNNVSITSNKGVNPPASANSSTANVGVQKGADSPLSSLIDLLKQLPEGKMIEAQVKSSQILSDAEKTLLQSINPSLVKALLANKLLSAKEKAAIQTSLANQTNTTSSAKTNPSIISPSPSSASPTPNAATLVKDDTLLLQKMNLFLVKLSLNLPGGEQQTTVTVTPQALKINESILIGQRDQQLMIDRTPSQKVQQAASETMKQILPKQQTVSQLQQFIQQLRQLPENLQTVLLTKSTQQALTALSNFSYTNNTLNSGATVKQAIADSGIQLEAKVSSKQIINNDLGALLNRISRSIEAFIVQQSTNTSATTTSIKNTYQATVQTSIQSTINNPVNSNSQSESIRPQGDNSTPLSAKDVEKVIAHLLNNMSANTSATANSVVQQNSNQTATMALMRLLGIPSAVLNTQNMTAATPLLNVLPKLIEQHLKQLIEKTQARIQLNQLRSLGLDKPQSDYRSAPLQQFHTELPLRFNEQILPVQITIQEQAHNHSKNEDEENEKQHYSKDKKAKCWQVFMSFELPNNEALHTRLTIIDDSVSATLWAESSSLCQKANNAIHYLRDKLLANGLHVDELNCLHGKPPQQDFSLDYNLVDIKT